MDTVVRKGRIRGQTAFGIGDGDGVDKRTTSSRSTHDGFYAGMEPWEAGFVTYLCDESLHAYYGKHFYCQSDFAKLFMTVRSRTRLQTDPT